MEYTALSSSEMDEVVMKLSALAEKLQKGEGENEGRDHGDGDDGDGDDDDGDDSDEADEVVDERQGEEGVLPSDDQ
jgi:hypothetical protein